MGITGSAQFGFDRRRMSLALRRLPEHPKLFAESYVAEAENLLQIGSRQVKALSDWIRWTGLAVRDSSSTSLTELGEIVLEHDETLEDALSWHLIHHKLSAERANATAYWLAFRKTGDSISRDDMLSVMRREEPGRKDRTYEDAYRNLAQVLANPEMSELAGIIEPIDGTYVRLLNPMVSPAFIAWMILDWIRFRENATTTLAELCGENGPARPFRMTEDHLAELVHVATDTGVASWMTLSRTAGLDSIAVLERPSLTEALREAYLRR